MAYQGWTNYETWAVSSWLDNDRELYRQSREMARLVQGEYKLYYLAKALEELVKAIAPDLGATLCADLLTNAIAQANYREISDHLLVEVVEDDDDETEGANDD